MARTDDARRVLLDTAERLFAEHGIPQVSDRKIAEAAGNSNHSAVRYYFGGRSELLRALLDRHLGGLEPVRALLYSQSTSLLGDIRALVLPLTSSYAELEGSTWRARFLDQAAHDPTTSSMLRESRDQVPAAAEIFASIVERLGDLDRHVVRARAGLMMHLVTTACAEIEERAARGEEPPRWTEAGDFLCDAIAGMLQAPITRR